MPLGAQALSQCRELRQVMQSHQEVGLLGFRDLGFGGGGGLWGLGV